MKMLIYNIYLLYFLQAIFGDYKWETYNEIYDRVLNFGRGLSQTDIEPREKVAIYLETRAEWFIAVQVL